jgi:16S rRNA (cytosine967-C5)-methyltransferase
MTNPRALAAQSLHRVIFQGESLSEVTQDERLAALSRQDKGLFMDLCYGTLRYHERISAILSQLLVKPLKKKDKDIEVLLHLGIYQMIYQRTPDHAAINETVKAAKKLGKKWAKSLINAVLRNLQREQASLLKAADENEAVKKSLPEWLFKRLQQAWPDDWEKIVKASNTKAPMSLRVNLQKNTRDEYKQLLEAKGFSVAILSDQDSALMLEKAAGVDELPGFFEGQVSVQDMAAQFAAPLLDAKEGMRVLDACAAPGGKTGHIAERYPLSKLTAIDSSGERLQRVVDNLQRLHKAGLATALEHIEWVESDAADIDRWWDGEQYDRILLDAPCSATGVIRRHPDIKLLRQSTDIDALVELQRTLLDAMWHILKPGGKLLYATCSILPDENEQQIKRFLQKQADAEHCLINLPMMEKIGTTLSYGRQILPGNANMDGFYYALLTKR